MAEEEVVAVSSPVPVDHHKRKLEDLESLETAPASDVEHVENGVSAKEVSDVSEAKRPRVEDAEREREDIAGEDGNENGKEETAQHDNSQSGEALEEEQPPAEEVAIENAEPSVQEAEQKVNPQPDGDELPSTTEQSENVVKPSEDEPLPVTEMPHLGETDQNLTESGTETTSRKLEVPNQMVGVLIGKAGDTIRNLQFNSGAKIQITRDADAEPGATTRPVELIGTLACINKAERLIKEVIAEADAGGSPALVARGFTLAAGVMEQIEIQVPNDKVGLVIGKGGETIKSLQTRSGARIQLVPQHLPEGDRSKERTVRVSGDKKQIDLARGLITEVMNQNIKPSTYVSNYGQQQQSFRPRGPSGPVPQWGPPRPRNAPSMPYDYHQHRGGAPYPSQNQHYPPPYGNYPPQGPPRGNFNPGWEQRPSQMQGPPSHSGGYDYYNAQGVPPSAPRPSMPSHPQPNYYGQQPPYSQTHPPQPSYQASQPSNVPYQAPVSVAPSYGQTAVPAQQPYPYASSVPATTTTANDGYNQQQQTGYPQQAAATSQPVAGYTQPGPGGYPQQAYGQYPQTQQAGAYSNQTPAYGYQGQADPSAYAAVPQAYSSAPPQTAAYAQPPAATHQGGYEQAGAYPPPAAAQPAGGYQQQQYDASQMYGASG